MAKAGVDSILKMKRAKRVKQINRVKKILVHWCSINIMHVHVICSDYHGIAWIFIDFNTFALI